MGVTNWTSLPEIFPNGLIEVKQKTGWTFAAHNRYWSGHTNYASENGGNYRFVIGEECPQPFLNYFKSKLLQRKMS